MRDFFTYSGSEFSMHYSCDKKPNPVDFQMHTHENCELYYFESGKGTFKIEGAQYPLQHGDILIMSPAESHYIDIDPNYPYTRFSIHFDREIFSIFDKSGFLISPFTERASGCFNLYRAEDFGNDSYNIFIENLLRPAENRRIEIISNLMPLLNEIAIAFGKKSTESVNTSLDHRIIKYINNNISNNITLDGICREFYISKPQLCRIFKSATGCTVWEYITVKRLVYAKALIAQGIQPTAAYSKCGFNDYSVFYRAYRKRYGVSPAKTEKSS